MMCNLIILVLSVEISKCRSTSGRNQAICINQESTALYLPIKMKIPEINQIGNHMKKSDAPERLNDGKYQNSMA